MVKNLQRSWMNAIARNLKGYGLFRK